MLNTNWANNIPMIASGIDYFYTCGSCEVVQSVVLSRPQPTECYGKSLEIWRLPCCAYRYEVVTLKIIDHRC